MKFSKQKTKKIETDIKTSYAKLMEEMANTALNSDKIKDLWNHFEFLDFNFVMPHFNLAIYSDSLETSNPNVKGLQLYIKNITLSGKVIKQVSLYTLMFLQLSI